MRAHGTQKTKTKAMCSNKTKTQAHGQKNNHQPCAKQDKNMQLMRISQPIKTRTARNNTRWQEKHKTEDTWTGGHKAEWTRDRTHTQDRKWSVSVQTPARNRNSRHECWDSNTTLQHETRHVKPLLIHADFYIYNDHVRIDLLSTFTFS